MIDSQISNIQNTSDVICNWLIQLFSYTSKYYGISYGELNIGLLSIGILLICLYFVGSVLNKKWLLLVTSILTIFVFIGVILFFGLVPLPDEMF